MEAVFNELSVFPKGERKDVSVRLNAFLTLVKRAGEEGYTAIRCPENGPSSVEFTDEYSLSDYIYEDTRDKKRILLLSIIKKPYFQSDSLEESTYVNGNFWLKKNETERISTIGLAAAFLRDTFALNLQTSKFWCDNKYQTLMIEGVGLPKEAKVLTLSSASDFDSEEYQEWKFDRTPKNWCKCPILPKDKKCNLSSTHHGNKELAEFAKRKLFPLDFVVEISTSLEYDEHCKAFVKAIHPETATIEVVLYREELGYSMVVKTTARNEIELRQMANTLEGKFGPKK